MIPLSVNGLTINKTKTELSKYIGDISQKLTRMEEDDAAVEAARAGAAGKGFAVVADEVRNLANKSAQAAKGTTGLIEDTIHAVENGTKIAKNTAESLQKVVAGTKAVLEDIGKIAAASNAQAATIVQLTQSISQITAVVETNAATGQESAAASEELSSQAHLMKDLIAQFSLNKQYQKAAE